MASGPMYNASTIAKWFIAWAEADEADLSNLKLQKLLYYAQGHALALFGRSLFKDEIQAWSHGPVVPSVYHTWKDFGSQDLRLPDTDHFTWRDVDPETTELLGKVWNTYGGFGGWKLRNMTHEESPWLKNWRGEDHRNVVICEDELREFFESVTRVER